MTDYDTALAEFVSKLDYKKMSKKQIANEKRWFTAQQNYKRKHEMKLQMIQWFLTDQEAKYWAAAATGAGIALAGTVLGEIVGEAEEAMGVEKQDRTKALPKPGEHGPWWGWLVDPMGSVIREVNAPMPGDINILNVGGEGLGPLAGKDFATNLSSIMVMGGASFAAANLSILYLRSIFSGTDLGEMMEGFGALIPFT